MRKIARSTLFFCMLALAFTEPVLGASIKDADLARKAGDIEASIEIYSSLAEAGNVDAMAELGEIYDIGPYPYNGEFRDLERAFYWSSKAAGLGNTDSQGRIAYMYAEGVDGVLAPDAELSAKWYRQEFAGRMEAAKQGDVFAMARVGVMFDQGLGTSHDVKAAHLWMRRAADKGNNYAAEWLAMSYLTGHGVAKNDAELKRWLRESIKIDGDVIVGYLAFGLEESRQPSCEEFLKAHELAASSGSVFSIHYLSSAYTNSGTEFDKFIAQEIRSCVRRDFDSARRILAMGVRLCDTQSMLDLARLHYEGKGSPSNYREAYKWYEKAANLGNIIAMNALGGMHVNGEGTSRSLVMAHMWYNLSRTEAEKLTALQREITGGANLLDFIEKEMSHEEVALAQQMAADWRPVKSCVPANIDGNTAKRSKKSTAPAGGARIKSNKEDFKRAAGE